MVGRIKQYRSWKTGPSSSQAQAEVDAVLGGRETMTVADYKALRYTMRCINESMRLYPHPPVLLRRANVPDRLPGEGSSSSVTPLPVYSLTRTV